MLIAAYCCVMCFRPFIVAIAVPCRPGMLWASALGTMCVWFALASEPHRSTPSACGSRRESWRGLQVAALMSLPVLSAADRCVICCRLHRQSIAVPCRPGMLWASALGNMCVQSLCRVGQRCYGLQHWVLCVFGLLPRHPFAWTRLFMTLHHLLPRRQAASGHFRLQRRHRLRSRRRHPPPAEASAL